MELVDIWHFILSAILINTQGDQQLASTQLFNNSDNQQQVEFDSNTYVFKDMQLLDKLELLVGLSASRRICLPLFTELMQDCGMDWNEMYRQYVGKNVLNFFRQDHGYKEGSYIKIWEKREDNEHLVEIMNVLDATSEKFQQQLYDQLKERYQAIAT